MLSKSSSSLVQVCFKSSSSVLSKSSSSLVQVCFKSGKSSSSVLFKSSPSLVQVCFKSSSSVLSKCASSLVQVCCPSPVQVWFKCGAWLVANRFGRQPVHWVTGRFTGSPTGSVHWVTDRFGGQPAICWVTDQCVSGSSVLSKSASSLVQVCCPGVLQVWSKCAVQVQFKSRPSVLQV